MLRVADGLSQFVSEIRAVLELPVMMCHVTVFDGRHPDVDYTAGGQPHIYMAAAIARVDRISSSC